MATVEEVKRIIDTNYAWQRGFEWNEDGDCLILDNDLEYQIREYSNGDFCSILVRFLEDPTHSYFEFYPSEAHGIYDVIDLAFSSDTTDSLEEVVRKRMSREMPSYY